METHRASRIPTVKDLAVPARSEMTFAGRAGPD
jgi:hypothetical protein